jgi:glycosyltransferase involved in cell wall biosynthesis
MAVRQDKSPRISVILPTFNRSELLRQCLAGFALQSLGAGEFEVVVMDDGSLPPVRHVVEDFADRLEITYLYQPNAGIAAARNAAILQARAPFLALHDDDDEPAPDYLEQCLEFHKAYPDEADILLARVVPHQSLRHTPLLDWIFDPNDGLIGFPDVGVHDQWRFYGGTSSCKRSLYRLGLHDPEYRFGLEDMELSVRLAGQLRLRVHYDGKPTSFLCRAPEFASIFRRSYVEGRSYKRFHLRHGVRARPIIRPGMLDPSRTLDEIGPILPQVLQGIHAVEPLEMDVPASFLVRHKGREFRGVDALHASYTLCAMYARALGWIDFSEDTPEKRGLRRIEALLNDYYYETAQGQRLVRYPRGRGALVYFPYVPPPADSGAGQRCRSMLRALRTLDYRVEMLISTAFSGSASIASAGAFERDLGIRLHIHDSTPEDLEFQAMADEFPWERRIPPGLHQQFHRIYREMEPELVLINYARWAELSYEEDFDESLRLIDTHDLDTVNQAMLEMLAPYFPERPVDPAGCDPEVTREDFFAHSPTAGEEEFRVYDRFDLTIATSAADAEAIRARARNTRVLNIPTTFTAAPATNRYDGSPVFHIADDLFDIQGYVYFARRVLPLVVESLPSFRLRIFGPGEPTVRPVPGIEVAPTIEVPGDLESIYFGAPFAICPLLGGPDIQPKILEAMAYGVPVIAVGSAGSAAQSSPIEHRVNGYIAFSAQEFSEYCLALSRDRVLCSKLGRAARETVKTDFSPAILEERLSAGIKLGRLGRGPERRRPRPLAAAFCPADSPAQLAGRRIVIFGAGAAGQIALRALPDVVGLVDNDPAKCGRLFEQIPVRSPESLRDRHQDMILVCSTHWPAITQQLIDMGFEPGRDFKVWRP